MPGITPLYQDAEQIIASYDYTDIAEGTGVETFYAYNYETSGSTSRALTSNPVKSYKVESTEIIGIGHGEASGVLTYDSSVFNAPRTIKGTALINFSSRFNKAGSDEIQHKATFQKVDSDNNVTDLGSAWGDPVVGTDNITTHAIAVDLAQTNFKKGDKLRLKVITTTNQASTSFVIAEDPADRDGTLITPAATYPTKFEVHVPFRLNL